jgi:hypothetical protein
MVERWQTVDVTRFNITERGHRALDGQPSPAALPVAWAGPGKR